MMRPLETGFGELDGSYVITLLYLVTQLLEWKFFWKWELRNYITLLGNPAIGIEKSLEMGVYVK